MVQKHFRNFSRSSSLRSANSSMNNCSPKNLGEHVSNSVQKARNVKRLSMFSNSSHNSKKTFSKMQEGAKSLFNNHSKKATQHKTSSIRRQNENELEKHHHQSSSTPLNVVLRSSAKKPNPFQKIGKSQFNELRIKSANNIHKRKKKKFQKKGKQRSSAFHSLFGNVLAYFGCADACSTRT